MKKLMLVLCFLFLVNTATYAADTQDYTPPGVMTWVTCNQPWYRYQFWTDVTNLPNPANTYTKFQLQYYVDGVIDKVVYAQPTTSGYSFRATTLSNYFDCSESLPYYARVYGLRSGTWYYIGQG